jgi:hypothetical protein
MMFGAAAYPVWPATRVYCVGPGSRPANRPRFAPRPVPTLASPGLGHRQCLQGSYSRACMGHDFVARLPVVKFERLLKVPRSGRTIHLVINIPEPMAVVTPPLKPTRRARIWAVLKVAGPSSVAIAAIIISILSLQGQRAATREQQRADAAAAAARERHEAQQVSFLQVHIPEPPYNSLRVENFGVNPVYDVTFQVNAFSARSVRSSSFLARTFTVWLGNIPSCSSGTIDMTAAVLAGLHKMTGLSLGLLRARIFAAEVNWMAFADSNGGDWQYTGNGEPLQRLESLSDSTFLPAGYLQAKYKTVVGCT